MVTIVGSYQPAPIHEGSGYITKRDVIDWVARGTGGGRRGGGL